MFCDKTAEDGQALVELLAVIVICFMLAVGIYEAGAVFHNVAVVNKALSSAAGYAAQGAPYPVIQNFVVEEAENLLSGAFLTQRVSPKGLILEVWNPRTNTKLGAHSTSGMTYRDQCELVFPPGRDTVTPYLFWTQGFTVRVGIEYQVGIYLPFLGPITLDTVLAQTKVIQTHNDSDRDGLADEREAEYVQWGLLQDGDTTWKHPRHRDQVEFYDSDNNVDVDGDGVDLEPDPEPYDFDNNGIEDRFDKSDNLLRYNPLIGPDGWLPAFPC